MAELRFYLDEDVPLEVARQLELSGVDVVSAHSLEKLGEGDVDHLRYATELRRVLYTQDQDFLRLAAEGFSHSGIVFFTQPQGGIGAWVRGLRALHARVQSAEDQVFFL